MLKRSLYMLLAVSAIMQSSIALAELKVGYYSNRNILANLPDTQTELKKLQAEFAPKEKEINDKQKELLKLKEDIEKNAPVMSQQDLQAKQLEYQSKGREWQLLQEDTKRVFEVRQNNLVQEIQNNILTEARKIAEEESYDLILTGGAIYVGPKVDITQKLLKRMSK